MGVRKRFTALLLVIIMLLSNLSFPLQSVVYGFNEGNNESKTINFHGDNLVVNDDGSVTFDCNLEDNQGRITIAVYNSENEKKSAEAQLMFDEETQTDIPNGKEAWLDLQTESYEGCYLIVTSDGNVDLSTLKFDIAGHNMFVQNEGRVDLPGDVEHINIDENTVRSIYEKKQVRFEGDNLVVNGVESATLDCPIEGNEGRLTFELYNSDNTKVNINRRMMWNDETQQEEPSETEASTFHVFLTILEVMSPTTTRMRSRSSPCSSASESVKTICLTNIDASKMLCSAKRFSNFTSSTSD